MIGEKVYNVVVTGAAPFRGIANPAQDVKCAMPDRIEREGLIPIRIIKYPIDFRNVITDMDIIPKLWNRERSVYEPNCNDNQKIYIDMMLHLGVGTRGYGGWRVEKQARRDGYDWVGDDGVPLPEHNGGKGERWEGLPEVLTPIFDVDKILQHVQEELPLTPMETSMNAGFKYCEFILYTSLATLYKREENARVLFVHHPGTKTTEQDIEESVKVNVSIICAAIDQLETK